MSRLDRLVLLLDTGSSAFVRNTAADQLADVQKAHPEDLLNLLGRVFPYLKSKKWDTRIAAARAIGGIVANTPKWNPNTIEELDENGHEVTIKPDPDIKLESTPKSETENNLLLFANFDLKNVLRHGGKLVGSAGKEYDDPLQDLDPIARLKHQKQNLKNKLGMAGQYLEDDLLNDADLADIKQPTPMKPPTISPIMNTISAPTRRNNKQKSSASPGPTSKSGRSTPESTPINIDPVSASDARRRAMARRKAKTDAKVNQNKVRVVDLSVSSAARRAEQSSNTNTPVPTAIKLEPDSDQPQWKTTSQEHNDKVVVEHQAPKVSPLIQMQQGGAGADKVWPFEGLCELLMVDLFDPAWEVRHGAVLGLREVIKVHGAGAGRVVGKSKTENDKQNYSWLEDLSCRLCCIFALDRFGDYVADQVVAPVRESAAQTLGALLLHLPEPIIKSTFDVLCSLVLQKDLGGFPLWEACHGGMLGLRYLVSVRTDILFKDTTYLDGLITCVLHGLQETDDDVQAMSAATLIPIASELVNLRPQTIPQLLEVIWNCLGDLKDDLSASIGNVMDLLAKLCAFPEVLDIIKTTAETDPSKSFTMLVPRLCPFLRHSITNVRTAVLRALQTFLEIEGHGTKDWIDARILRLVFQNLLVEQNEQVLKLSLELWNKLLNQSIGPNASYNLSELFGCSSALSVLTLLMTPIGAARHSYKMDTSIFIKPSGAPMSLVSNIDQEIHSNGNGNGSKTATTTAKTAGTKRKRKAVAAEAPPAIPVSFEVNIDSPILSGDVTLLGFPVFLCTKIAASKGFGRLLALWDPSQLGPFVQPLTSYLASSFSTQRLVAGLILEEYGNSLSNDKDKFTSPPDHSAFKNEFIDKFTRILNNETPAAMYRDFTPYIKAVRTQCLSLFSIFVDSARLPRHKIPQIAVVVQGEPEAGPDAFSIETAENIAGPVFDKLKRSLSASYRVTYSKAIDDAHRSLQHAITEANEAKTSREISIMAATAAAYVSLSSALPKKLNPIIRSLMDSIKAEEHPQLQVRAAASVAKLVSLFLDVGKTGASDKVIKNLCSFLCVDTSEVPEFHPNQQFLDKILSLRKEEAKTDPADIIAHQKEVKAARIKRLGAKTALENLSHLYGPDLLNRLPKLKECMFAPLPSPSSDVSDTNIPESICDPESTLGQDMIDALSVIRALLPCFHPSLHAEFLPIFQLILKILKLKFSVLRYSAAKCFATICSVMPIEGITFLVENILPAVPNAIDLYVRQGAIECIYHLTATMGSDILPYVVFLIVPVLGRMSDADKDIRLIATTTFASIIKLVPLESGIPDPPGMSAKLLEGRDREREFISQMLDVSKVQNFPLPVAIKASLRSYQQEGVNWLAFLNKYHLHGILCDDMGLGKTLQTICIVASDHHLREQEHAKTGSPETRKLPTLIVCPPTLTGHWMHELNIYAPFLKVLCYVGVPSIRQDLANSFNDYDVVVTSYDITRNDIRLLAPQNWNYCVLDEGHIIKNASSKLTQAVKTLVANHRLVLSGTPIQNNVLELWSLFDFLMPGFLGTEKVFNDRFAKPIAASRNSKSSSKEQEAGALALEALHKQVLPFLLRRLKEDVLSDLPPKIIQDYYCDLSDLQKQLYETFAKKQKPSISGDMANSSKEGKQHIFQALQYMRKLCNHPALVLNTKHPQYETVMKQLQARSDNIRNIHHAPKLMALQALLKDCGIGDVSSNSINGNKESQELSAGVTSQHRALIFCQLKDMLDMVENDLLKKCMPGVTYMRLDGSTDVRHRHDIVQKFNGDPSIDVLLLTTHVGGLGLNLTGADTVIFVEHDWNPMNDLQAMDRAHRIGQKKVVNVYRLITRNTLEEKIMGLQKFKLNIASTVINQQNSGLSSMDTDQLLDLFDVPEASSITTNGGTDEGDDGALDETGQIKGKQGAPNPIAELGELWDEKEYEEEYNLDAFIQSLQM